MKCQAPPTSISLRNATLVEPHRLSTEPLFLSGGRIAASPVAGMGSRDLRDHLIFPGLINAHDHLHLNAFPPLEPHEPFPNSYAWMAAFQPRMSDPHITALRAIPSAVRHWHGALKNLLCGATTVAHHDPMHPVFDEPAFPVRVLRDFGWSHSLGLGASGSDRTPLSYGPSLLDSFASTPATQPWIIHLAEGTDLVAALELKELDAMGRLAANTVLVHGVGLSETDQDLVIARQAGVIWCPVSNLTLLGRTLAPRRLMDAGRLALGSDTRISGSFDLLHDLREAAAHSDAASAEILDLVTERASRLLAMPEVGGLAPGQRADLLILPDMGAAPYDALLQLRRADIRAVVRDGKPAVADPDFADWFTECGVAASSIRLDERPKLCATALLGPPEAAALEPGLEILEPV